MADLIINSGIQFISIPINLSEEITSKIKQRFADEEISNHNGESVFELKEIFYWQEEDILIDKNSINEEAYSRYGELEIDKINRNYIIEKDEDETYSVSGKEALEICEGFWIPLPYFRIRQDPERPFHHGPENWCRMNIQPYLDEENGTTHILTLAFDTSAGDEDGNDYFKPNLRDASDNGNERFKCVIEKRHAPRYFTTSELWDWMFNIFGTDQQRVSRNNHLLKHIAAYHTLLELLNSCDAFPEIGLLSGEENENPIEVGLTIDIGNSRTCGLLCEKSRPFESHQPFDFTSARKLQIRNLSRPHKIYDEPFEMQIAFSEEKFGNSATEMIDDVFEWPSLVRVGPEAIELTSYFESEDSQASLSSPKRYLWDDKEVKIPWIKVDSNVRYGFHQNIQRQEKALYGIGRQINDKGKLIKDSTIELGASDSRYSRSSLMMFAIYEILLHAINQINSPEFRRDQGNSTYRRVLKDVIVTCPTAMTIQEQYVLRKSVKDAIELIHKTMEKKIDFQGLKIDVYPELPSLDPLEQENNPWKMDEAMCSQLAFLYGELIHKYSAKEKIFFDLIGKYRNGEKTKSVNIASIDIGGGTTDLMISNYKYDKDAGIPVLTPDPIFWEGFSIAGDDIVKRIIEKVVIPTIHKDIEAKDGKNVVAVINELFGENIGGQTAIDKIYRKQFANLVGAPIVYKIFNYLINKNENDYSFKISEIFEEFEKPKSKLIPSINKKIQNKTGIQKYDIQDVEIKIEKSIIDSGIEDVIGNVLKQLSFLVSHFDCDILLLSGRPSRLPIITDIISSTLNFSPDIIVNLGNYRFGNWYPFADSTGYVNDPKSTVTVGALIAYLNNISRLPGLRFIFDNMSKIRSTANYIGLIGSEGGLGNIKNEKLIFTPDQNEGEFKFYGEPMEIGMRQLKSENWIATPLYLFDFRDDERKRRLSKEYSFPYTVRFKRTQAADEFIKKDDLEVFDNNGEPIDQYNFYFSLRTSYYSQLHWKDSGSFVTRIE